MSWEQSCRLSLSEKYIFPIMSIFVTQIPIMPIFVMPIRFVPILDFNCLELCLSI